MADSLGDLLGQGRYKEPPEIQKIKDFVNSEVGIVPVVSMNTTAFVIKIPSAGAATNLRFKIFQLQRSLGGDRKIIIKIG